MIAGLLDDGDDGKNLLDATRGLAGAFSALLKAAQEGGGADSEVRIIILNGGLVLTSLIKEPVILGLVHPWHYAGDYKYNSF